MLYTLQDYPIEKWYENIMENLTNEIHCSLQYCGFSE